MERLMFTFVLNEGQEEEYDRRHREVWPALLHDLYAAGWRNYSLFRRGREVYAYAECHPDAATALSRMSASEANRDWARWFEEVIERLTDDDGQLFVVPEVWHLDEEAARPEEPDPERPGPAT